MHAKISRIALTIAQPVQYVHGKHQPDMVQPRTIGPFITGPPKPATARAMAGRAVVPGSAALREVELFDARPVLNQRTEIIAGSNSSFRYLRMARVALDPESAHYAPIKVATGASEEALFYVNRGRARIDTRSGTHTLGMGDVLYVGLDEAIRIASAAERCDVSEFRAVDCHTKYPEALVRHTDIEGTVLAADVGTKRPMSKRTVYKLVDQNIGACRLLFGDTFMAHVGGVGSYPPHFHGPGGPYGLEADAKEEIYHFRCASVIPGDMPYVLQNCARPGEPVNTYVHLFDEQAINVTPNFHDTIAPATVDFMFVWCLGAFTENERDWSRIVTRPGYEDEW